MQSVRNLYEVLCFYFHLALGENNFALDKILIADYILSMLLCYVVRLSVLYSVRHYLCLSMAALAVNARRVMCFVLYNVFFLV
jgi:hypothetical protein